MTIKKLALATAEKLSTGLIIGLGIAIAVTTVVAFQSLSTTPSDSGFQSGGTPMLTRTGGTYDRETNSLEVLGKSIGLTMISAESASTYTQPNAVNYCRDLSAACAYMVDESTCVSGTFTDWRLPTISELNYFIGLSSDGTTLWTNTPGATLNNWLYHGLNSTWNPGLSTFSTNVRCVR